MRCFPKCSNSLVNGYMIYNMAAARLFSRQNNSALSSQFISILNLGRYASNTTAKTISSNLVTGENVDYQNMPIVHVKATYNNTLVTLTDHEGKAAWFKTAGMVGFKKSKRSSSYAGQMAALSLGEKAKELGVMKVRVKLNGLGPGRQMALKGLVDSGLQVISITDTTPMPHNGMRPKKQRRL